MLALALALLALTATQARTFNITELDVPQIVPPHQKEVEIGCTYEGNFTILSWFKGPNEFFRFRPGAAPSTRSFPVLGVGRIEMLVCGQVHCRLRLGSLTEEASGLYRCDLEKVTPPYNFATRSAYMQVQGHQQRKPIVEGLAEEYGEGDEMLAFCRASQDAEIRWYINGHEVIDLRGAYTFRKISSWLMFIGQPPKIVVQCAEFRYGGSLSGSKDVQARWKESNDKDKRAQEQRKNSAPIEKNTVLLWMFLFYYF